MKMHKIWILTKVIIDKLLWYVISTDLHMYTSQAETAPPLTSNVKHEHWEAKYVQHTELKRIMDKLVGINRTGLPLRRNCESQALSQFVCLSASALPWSRTFLMQPLISCLLILFHSLHPTCESTTCYDMNTCHVFPEIISSPCSKIPFISLFDPSRFQQGAEQHGMSNLFTRTIFKGWHWVLLSEGAESRMFRIAITLFQR